jgi:hypothetical protein
MGNISKPNPVALNGQSVEGTANCRLHRVLPNAVRTQEPVPFESHISAENEMGELTDSSLS